MLLVMDQRRQQTTELAHGGRNMSDYSSENLSMQNRFCDCGQADARSASSFTHDTLSS